LFQKDVGGENVLFVPTQNMQKNTIFNMFSRKTIKDINTIQKNYSITKINFADDALPSSYLRALADKLLKENITIEWSCNIIINLDFMDDSFCTLLRKASLRSVAIGLESITPRITAMMKKTSSYVNARSSEKRY